MQHRLGFALLVNPSEFIDANLLWRGCHSPSELALAVSLHRDGIFIDGGAYIGEFSLAMAALSGSKVVAVEPSAGAATRLLRAIKLNELNAEVEVVRRPLWDVDGEQLALASRSTRPDGLLSSGTRHVVPHHGQSSDRLTSVTVDSLVDPDEPVALIKLDLEGAEPRALVGAVQTIRRWSPFIILELHPAFGNSKLTLEFLAELGYEVFTIRKGARLEPVRDIDRWQNVLARPPISKSLFRALEERATLLCRSSL